MNEEREVWKEIQGHREVYQISNLGNVRTKARQCKDHISEPHEKKKFINSNGYYRVGLNLDGKNKMHLLHRLVAQLFIPNPENKPYVNHIDGNKLNCRADNLEWCTRSENEIHAWRIGLKTVSPNHPAGEKHGMHKLSADDVAYIRSCHVPYDATYGSIPLAKKFNVRPQTITDIAHYRTWKAVGE